MAIDASSIKRFAPWIDVATPNEVERKGNTSQILCYNNFMNQEVSGILVAARDLRSPLSLMRQLALGMDFEHDSQTELVEARDQIVATSERALRQVEDLTKLARLEGSFLDLEPVNAPIVCDEVTRELTQLFNFNQKQLLTRYPTRLPLAAADREMLKTVVSNFCQNAAHYSGEVSHAELTVSVHHRKLRIDVRDFGPALPKDVWQAMRDGWIEKPLSISMRPGSSGLGLYIASRMARAMRAEVGAVRHADGSSFYIDLQLSQQRSFFG